MYLTIFFSLDISSEPSYVRSLSEVISPGYKYVPLAIVRNINQSNTSQLLFFGSGHPLGVGVE